VHSYGRAGLDWASISAMFRRLELRTVAVVPDMKLSPNVGSDRSWVWNAAADVSEGEPEPQTLAIRFGNSESTSALFHLVYRVESDHGPLFRCQPFQRSLHQSTARKRGLVPQGSYRVDKQATMGLEGEDGEPRTADANPLDGKAGHREVKPRLACIILKTISAHLVLYSST